MDIFDILTMLGGLILFLFGMNFMGDGLKKLAGGKLESILGRLTSTKTKGFILGLIVTAIIQSSSATTVMIVGFVNSGMMKLAQSIGIILGANVGTTVTAWILSLSGINGEGSIILKLLKPENFTPILALIGFLMMTVSDRTKHKNLGSIFIGFSILMFGMKTMSSIDTSAFSSLLIKFSNPIMGILIGTVITAIIQSSSASVGILQALSLTSTIPYSIAIPIILGANLGTTITPILSALNGNTSAKRVAVVCLYIKLISIIVIAVLFYILNGIFGFAFMSENVNVVTIAIVHTAFNVISTALILPFDNAIIHLAKTTVKGTSGKEDEENDKFAVLEDRFLSVPSFAVENCRQIICDMVNITKDSVLNATKLLEDYNKSEFKKITESESEVDRYEDKTGAYLVKLAALSLSSHDSREVTCLLHIVGDIERISDHSVTIASAAQEMNEKNLSFSEFAKHDIKVINDAVCEIISITAKAFCENDLELAKQVEPLDGVIDMLRYKVKNNHIRRLQEGRCTVELGFILSDLLNTYERIAGHCSNVAVCMLEPTEKVVETHDYLKHVKADSESEYYEQYEDYKNKYSL